MINVKACYSGEFATMASFFIYSIKRKTARQIASSLNFWKYRDFVNEKSLLV